MKDRSEGANPAGTSSEMVNRLTKPVLPVISLIAVLLLSVVASAEAATTHEFESSFGGQLAKRGALAVTSEEGRVFASANYVAEGGEPERSAIDIFGPNGESPAGLNTNELGGPEFVESTPLAFDDWGSSPARGTLYVTNRSTEGGITFGLKRYGLNQAENEYVELAELPGTPSPVGPSGKPGNFPLRDGLAVGPNGNIFWASYSFVNGGTVSEGWIAEFDPAGNEVAQFAIPPAADGRALAPIGLTVDAAGDLFVEVTTEPNEQQGEEVLEYTAGSDGQLEATVKPKSFIRGTTHGITFDPEGESLLAVIPQGGGKAAHVEEFAVSGGARQGSFGGGRLATPRGIAVNKSDGNVYVASAGATGGNRLSRFGPVVQLPEVTSGSATNRTVEAVQLNGTINPKGFEIVSCAFEYGQTISYSHAVPCAEGPAEIGSGEAPVPVHADVAGLRMGHDYHFRLAATVKTSPTETPESNGEDATFSTLGAGVGGTTATNITETTATLVGGVEPHGEAAEYSFEYLTEAEFASHEWGGALHAPAEWESVGNGQAVVPVSQSVSGLSPFTTYRFRLVARTPAGTTEGEIEESGEEAPRLLTTFPEVPGSGACPNELLRIGPSLALPDCRAYEQVSPTEKNGSSVQGEPDAVQAAPTGNAITFFANSGLPGGEGAQNFPSYMATLTGGSWTNSGLLPPASTGREGKVLGWSEDLSTVFTENKAPEEGSSLYSRSSTGGPVTQISEAGDLSVTLPFDVAGTSDGGNVVFFESEASLAPGAVAHKPNAYVWNKATGAVVLAGVLNEGQAPEEGTFAGPYAWFKNELASGGPNALYFASHEAITPDGASIYFTAAGSGRLYERLNPTQRQSAMAGESCTEAARACTIEISASQKTNGEGDAGADPNGSKPAPFLGTSGDGSPFFLSASELTNDATTGDVGVARANLDGSGVEPGFLPSFATALAIDAGHIYWANPAGHAIGRSNIDGTQVEPQFIPGIETPEGVTVDGSFVYWTDAKAGNEAEGTIGRAKLDGTEVNQSFISGASDPHGIAVDASNIFWANQGPTATTRKIGHAKLTGAGKTQGFISVSGESGADGLSIQGSTVYWSNPDEGTIGSASVLGSEVNQTLVAGAGEPLGLATDGAHIYWANAAGAVIGRAEITGGSVEPSFVPGVPGPAAVAADASHLYWSENNGDQGADLYRFDNGTGQLTDLAPDSTDPAGAEVKGVLGVGGGGSDVYFVAKGIPDGVSLTPNALGERPEATGCEGTGLRVGGLCNLYRWHDGTIQFITRLEANETEEVSDSRDWSPSAGGSNSALLGNTARVSADGSTLLFRSSRRLGSYDNVSSHCPRSNKGASAPGGCNELYLSVDGGAPDCVSCDPTGTTPLGNAAFQAIPQPFAGPRIPDPIQTRNLSADGMRVFFDTPDKLVAGDTNGVNDVYEWEAPDPGDPTDSCQGTQQDGGCLYLISGGTSPQPSYFGDASSSGESAFFFTGQPLVAQDQDELVDVYDARINGGLASQSETVQPPCFDEASCASPAASPPGAQQPAAPSGEGNPSRGVTCRKGFKKIQRNGRPVCVKKQTKKHHRKPHKGKKHRHLKKHKGKKHRHVKKRKGKHNTDHRSAR